MPDEESRTVTKRELVNRIAEETGQTKVVVRDVLQRFLDSVIDELVDGNRLEFRDFGVFEVRERPARVAQNPRTLEKVPVPAKHVVRFKAGRVMRERVCEEAVTAGADAANCKPGQSGRPDASKAAAAAGSPAGAASIGGGGRGATVNGAAGRRDADTRDAENEKAAEMERGKPTPPAPPPAKPGSPF